jgi:hypothetical protein
MHTAKPLVPETSASEVEAAIGKLKRNKSPDVDQIPAELKKEKHCLEIHKLINLIWNKEDLPPQWKGSDVVPVHIKG